MADDGPQPAGEAEPAAPAPTIWPPVEPGADEAADTPEAPAQPVAAQFPGLDPQLLSQSVEVTSAAQASPVPGWRQQLDAVRVDWLPTRYPLLVVTAILFVLSLPRATESVVGVVGAFPVVGTLSVVLWALYAFPLIWLITRFDFFEREPSPVISFGLAWGGVIATSMAVSANQGVFSLLTSLFGKDFTQRWGAAIAAPTTEESLKAIGIIAVLLLARRGIRSAIDGFVIGAMVGLGFQVFENFVYTGNLLLATGDDGNQLQTMLNVFVVRGIGSGLWSHAAYSGVAGLGIGYAFTRTDRTGRRRFAVAVVLFLLAWLLHFIWNFPILLEQAGAVGSFAAVVKAGLIVGLLLVVLMRNAGRESYIYTDYLESVHDPDIITLHEIEALRTYRSREAATRAAALTGGEKAAGAVRALQRAQADLSVALANGDLESAGVARRDIAQARSRMAASALIPPAVGHGWGVAGIWAAVIGVLVPVLGPLVAAVLAGIGTRQARKQGVEVADSVKAAWLLAGLSLLVGLAVVLVLAR